MASNREWQRAFARQGFSDLKAREILVMHGEALPPCHELHLLQMACEKLAKAHLYGSGSPPPDVQKSHSHIAKQIPILARQQYTRLYRGDPEPLMTDEFRRLCREIELLHPQVDHGGTRPDNCEYPWEDVRGRVHTPVGSNFKELSLRSSRHGPLLLKLISFAAERLQQG